MLPLQTATTTGQDGDMTISQAARCACGQVQVDCFGEPAKVSVCHCLECQRRTGSVFGVAVFFARCRVRISGETRVYDRGSDSGFSVMHHFCPQCGTTAFWYPSRKPEMVAVALGCFADPTFQTPQQQVYEHYRHAWVTLTL